MTALVPAPIELGYKLNFTDLNAAIGRVQLRRQPDFRSIRQKIAQHYVEEIRRMEIGFGFQDWILHDYNARHLFVIILPLEKMSLTRDELVLKMRDRNIGMSIHYSPLHLMPLYHPENPPALPVTEYAAKRIATLPIGVNMTTEDADYVIEHLRDLVRR